MSVEGDVAVEVPASEVAVTQSGSAITLEDAIRVVLRNSLHADSLARGHREVIKALDREDAKLCVLAESCDSKEYVKLVEALCSSNNIKLLKVADGMKLGEWAGLCKIDKNGDAQKVVRCSCVVVRDFGVESEHLEVLNEYLKRV